MNIKLKFLVAALVVSVVWGTVLVPTLVTSADNNDAVSPLVATLIYYGGIYVTILLFLKSLIHGMPHSASRFALIVLLLFVLVSWYEPPLVVGPDGSLSKGPGFKASLDYGLGFYIHNLGYSWIEVYRIESWLVPLLIGALVIFLATPQTLGKALRRL